jgi:acylphosphatase
MEDGNVEAVIEGKDADVEKMLAWCKIGPPAARVGKVIIAEEHYTGGFSGFSIKYL